ncbi:MAG: FtsW/RodA/SpoVE family cell cycle protein [Opitutales bacterium]
MGAALGGLGDTWRLIRPAHLIALIAVVLTGFGLVILGSAGHSHRSGAEIVFKKQGLWVGLALCVFFVAALANLNWIRRMTWAAYGLAAVALVLVLIPEIGIRVNGAQRWLGFDFIRVQPSELAKVALVLGLADYLSLNQRRMRTFRFGFVVPGLVAAIPCGLIFLQPDFGTTLLFVTVALLLMFLSGTPFRYLVPAGAIFGGAFATAVYFDPVRWERITSFLNVAAHRDDGAWQLWQGLLAFAAGGWDGVGLGNGRQQLAFLPEAHTDFIFPIIGEELGLWFTGGVLLLFLAIFAAGVRTLTQSRNLYTFNVAAGALFFLTLQALVNIGVATGSLPTKGLSLPFISYGGSNLITMFCFVGLLCNCQRANSGPTLERRRDL